MMLRNVFIGAKILPIFAQVSNLFFIHHQFQIGHFITPWRLSGSADGISDTGGSRTLFFRSARQESERLSEESSDNLLPPAYEFCVFSRKRGHRSSGRRSVEIAPPHHQKSHSGTSPLVNYVHTLKSFL